MQIANYVDQNEIVADVGSDHGHLVMYLIANKICFKAYAIDNKKGPYEILKYNTKEYSNAIIPVFSNGLENIPSDCSTAIIAGLGAHTIVDIARRGNITNINNFVIDSHNDVPYIRDSFSKLGYQIVAETLLKDNNKYYVIIKLSRGIANYSPKQLYFGPKLLENKNDIFISYYSERKNRIIKLLNERINEEKKKTLQQELSLIEEEV
jgi:tRNA (adenine22-N1)-methyltransferase